MLHHVADDYIPVIASVGADRDGHSYNVNADEAAGAVARALRAYKVLFLTDVAGLAARPGRPGVSVISEASSTEVEEALAGVAGGMRPEAAGVRRRDPRRRDVRRTSSTAACAHSLLLELFTDAGIGTKIRAAA